MPLVFNNDRWEFILILLNTKRNDVGFPSIIHTFEGWVKQSDIDCLRDGLIEILPSYGYNLASALHAAGYPYDTWKTWTYNWIAELSLDEIEDILNILVISELAVHSHTPEGKELGSVLVSDIFPNTVKIYYERDDIPGWVYLGLATTDASDHPKIFTGLPNVPMKIKETFNGMELIQHIDNLQTITFNWTRIETFNLIEWLDNHNINQDMSYYEDITLLPYENFSKDKNDLVNKIVLGELLGNASTGVYEVRFILEADLHGKLTNNILYWHVHAKVTHVSGGGYGSVATLVSRLSMPSNKLENVSILPQSFATWYWGHLEKNKYHTLLAKQAGSTLSTFITGIGNVLDYRFGILNASIEYDGIYFRPNTTSITALAGFGYPDYPSEDEQSFSGYMNNYFFSSLPYDIRGIAV